jgi:hypothetical protein
LLSISAGYTRLVYLSTPKQKKLYNSFITELSTDQRLPVDKPGITRHSHQLQ